MNGTLDLALLHTLRAVARAGSFRRAADTLHVTQPAVTKQIQALEHAVGERLLERGRPLRLTPAGEVLVRYAEQIAGLVRSAGDELGDLRHAGPVGRVALGASYSVADFLPRLLERSRTRHPGVTITVESGWPDEIVRRVLDRELDVGLVVLTRPRPDEPDGVSAVPLTENGMVFIAPAHGEANRFPRRGRATVTELAKVPWILNHRSCVYRLLLARWFAEHGASMDVAVDGVGVELQCRLVGLGAGGGPVPESFVTDRGRRRRVRVIHVPGFAPRSIVGLVHRRDKYIHAALRGVMTVVQEMFPRAPLAPLLDAAPRAT